MQEYRISRADGRVVWIRDEMTVVRGDDGHEPPLFFGVFLDVTDRKRMEAELERLALYDSAHRTAQPRPLQRPPAPRDRSPRPQPGDGGLLPRPGPLQADQRQPRPRRRRRGPPRGGGAHPAHDPTRGHRGPLRRRRVHRAVRVRRWRARGRRRGGPPSARAGRAGARRRRRAAPERQHRDRDGRARRRGRGLAPRGGRRRRDVQGEGARRRPHRAVRHGDARARGGGAVDRAGASARARARRAAPLLPAAREPGERRDGRRRGAHPLAAPRARAAQPGQVPPGGRGERPDRAGGRVGGR